MAKQILNKMHQDYPNKIKELENKIAKAQALGRRDHKFVNDTKVDYSKKRIIFA